MNTGVAPRAVILGVAAALTVWVAIGHPLPPVAQVMMLISLGLVVIWTGPRGRGGGQ